MLTGFSSCGVVWHQDPGVRNQFIGSNITYGLYNCTMVCYRLLYINYVNQDHGLQLTTLYTWPDMLFLQPFFLVILQQRWVCFAWNLDCNKIVVFDPACDNRTVLSRQSIYTKVVDMLKSTLTCVMPILYRGWDHDWSAANILHFPWRTRGMIW